MRALRALAIVAVFALLIAGGGRAGFWIYEHLIFGLDLREQPALVRFPPETRVEAEGKNRIRIGLDGNIQAEVPFRQTLQLPLHGSYNTNIRIDTVAPIQFTITYRGVIPIDTMATIHGVTDFNYQKVKRLRNVAFTAQIPLKFEQPIALTVPVTANLRLVYSGPLGVVFDQTVSAPVDTTLHTSLKARREISTPILARFGLKVQWPQTPIPVIITKADLGMELNTLRLEKAPRPAGEGE